MAKKTTSEQVIQITRPDVRVAEFNIIGKTPLLVHRVGKKYEQELLDKGNGKAHPKEKVRDWDFEFRDSLYYLNGDNSEVSMPDKIGPKTRFGFPASAFKKAMVAAARQYKDVTMTELKGRFFVMGYFVEIKGKPVMDKFLRRIGGKGPGTGTPDIGIRARFDEWSATIKIEYLANTISVDSLANLLSTAGFTVGIGEDRPEKSGNTCGMWTVK